MKTSNKDFRYMYKIESESRIIARKIISYRITKFDLSYKGNDNPEDLNIDILNLSFSHAYFDLGKIEYGGYTLKCPDLFRETSEYFKVKLSLSSGTLYFGKPQQINIKNPNENNWRFLSHFSFFTWGRITEMSISANNINENFIEAIEKDCLWLKRVDKIKIEIGDYVSSKHINTFIDLINKH